MQKRFKEALDFVESLVKKYSGGWEYKEELNLTAWQYHLPPSERTPFIACATVASHVEKTIKLLQSFDDEIHWPWDEIKIDLFILHNYYAHIRPLRTPTSLEHACQDFEVIRFKMRKIMESNDEMAILHSEKVQNNN